VWSSEENTVAHCTLGNQPFIGVNSQALRSYTKRDYEDATRLRTKLIENYPEVMNSGNIGQRPNDAVYHAETNCLLRAARASGGTLKGQAVTMTVDRPMCPSCLEVLPKIGIELGNPTVTFLDEQGVVQRVMRGGEWLK
jgi:hypothetical protein